MNAEKLYAYLKRTLGRFGGKKKRQVFLPDFSCWVNLFVICDTVCTDKALTKSLELPGVYESSKKAEQFGSQPWKRCILPGEKNETLQADKVKKLNKLIRLKL